MKTIFARIGMELSVSDQEFERLKWKSLEFDEKIQEELAERFIREGSLCKRSFYIPEIVWKQ